MVHIAAIVMRENAAVRKKAGNANAIANSMKPNTRSYSVSKWNPIISTTGIKYDKQQELFIITDDSARMCTRYHTGSVLYRVSI